MDAIQPGGVGGTFGGQPGRVRRGAGGDRRDRGTCRERRRGAARERLRARLDQLAEVYPLIGEVRGLGAMQAIELVRDPVTKEPAVQETALVVQEARARGLLLLPAGTYGNVIRFLMPLTTSDAVLDEGLDVFDAAMTALGRR